MRSSYDASLDRLLKDEGGYTDHPSDPGGPTNFGITLVDARRYWKGNATADDVRTMPQSVARQIYRERYWNAMRCDELPAGVDYAVFDYGVNSGIGRAGKVLRRVLDMPDTTSAITNEVVAAAARRNASDLVAAICAERLAFLQALKIFPVFGRGWTTRVNGVRAAALAMAQGRVVATSSSEISAGKAVVPAKNPAGPASAGAVIAAGTAAAATTSRIEVAVLVIAAALAASVAVFLIWRWRHRWQQEAAVTGLHERTTNGLG